MRSFPADDKPHAPGLAGQVQHAGDLGDPGAVAGLAAAVISRRPRRGGDFQDRVADVAGDRHPDRVCRGRAPHAVWPGDRLRLVEVLTYDLALVGQ